MKDGVHSWWHIAGWVSMVLIIMGYYFNANQNPVCWVIWFVGNIIMGLYCCEKKTYPPHHGLINFITITYS